MASAMPGFLGATGFTTVGDVMNRMNADIGANPVSKRRAFDAIIGTGLDVKEPASRLPGMIGGGLAGHMVANYLGANRFWRNAAAVAGAVMGYRSYGPSDPREQHYHVI